MALQKVFLLPPLKGLNLYDNPFTMSPDYAVDLTNFMPPTTTFTVRPGVEIITQISGQVRGIYSYSTGSVIDYGENWYNANVNYGAASFLLIKLAMTNGTTELVKIDLNSSEKTAEVVGTLNNSYYNDDSALVKHTMFFASGSADSSVYLYHQKVGLASFELCIGQDGSQAVGNISTIAVFKGYIFFSTPGSSNITAYYPPDPDADKPESKPSDNALNIFFTKTQYADILDPSVSQFWKVVENIFSPHYGSCFSIDGALQNGGNILKLCNISRSGSDSISTYLAAITDQGEIVLFDGTDPADTTGANWQIAGKFQIPPPLNKWAFADMEGDLIVVTKNGLVSLRRVIFGQSTEITENLEYRLMSLFKEYMFLIPSFSQFVGLFYHPRNRLLIFNVPTDLPMPFNQIVRSYNFNNKKSLIFSPITAAVKSQILDFVKKYIVKNGLNYSLTIELNADMSNSFIKIDFSGMYSKVGETYPATITLSFSIKEPNSSELSLLNKNIQFNVSDMNSDTPVVDYDDEASIDWNPSLVKDEASNKKYVYQFKSTEDLIVTNIIPGSSVFFKKEYAMPLGFYNFSKDFTEIKTFDIWNNFFYIYPNQFYTSITDVINSEFPKLSAADTYVYDFNNFSLSSNLMDIHFNGKYSLIRMLFRCLIIGYCATYANLGQKDMYNWSINYSYPLNVSWEDENGDTVNLNCGINLSATIDATEHDQYRTKALLGVTGTFAGYEISAPAFLMMHQLNWGDIHQNLQMYFEPWSNPVITELSPKKYTIPSGAIVRCTTTTDQGWTNNNSGCWYYATRTEFPSYHIPQNNDGLDFPSTFGWYVNNCAFNVEIPDVPSHSKVEPKYPTTLTNVDLTTIPFFNLIDISCNFASTQYVFDSHFGTWSSFKDVNMMRGIEHQNDFYFVVPNDISYDSGEYIVTSSSLCRFNPDQLGDMIPNSDYTKVPINCSYKTVPTFDLGMPNKKIFKRLKIFGTPSVFWQGKLASDPDTLPLIVTPFWDFKEGATTSFIHAFDGNATSEKVLKKHFAGKSFYELNFIEKKKFWEKYKEENDMLSFVSIPIVANPGTRFGLEIAMTMREAYMDIYGFEVYFEPTGQIL